MSEKTRIDQPAMVLRSAVGGYMPSSALREENAESPRIAQMKGDQETNSSPMFSRTSFSTCSTIHSATSCRFEDGRTAMPLVSTRHRMKTAAITIHEFTCVSVMGIPFPTGMVK